MTSATDRMKGRTARQRVGVISQFRPWPKMVGWYDPLQLIRTGIDVLISSIFGQYADSRAAMRPETGAADATAPFDYTVDDAGVPRRELWIDYVSDLGDGWHSTYNVAYTVSRPVLSPTDPSGHEAAHQLPRANVMIFGGDEVYPVASRAGYQDRLVRPYEAALRDSVAPHPHLFTVPGNHDWYDNLVAFTRLFCVGRWFAGWQTKQRRSYFALKLPYRLVAHRRRRTARLRHRHSSARVFQGDRRADGTGRPDHPMRPGAALDLRQGVRQVRRQL